MIFRIGSTLPIAETSNQRNKIAYIQRTTPQMYWHHIFRHIYDFPQQMPKSAHCAQKDPKAFVSLAAAAE